MRHPIVRSTLPVVFAALALTACSGPAGDAGSESGEPTAAPGELTGALTIYAAASLNAAFDELAIAFEARHPNLDVLPITYDGSSVLVTQLIEGAPADVLASADERNMKKLVDAGLTLEPVDFATNVLTIAVAPGNPLGIETLDDLADGATETADGLPITVVLCGPEVPCGDAAQSLFAEDGITVTPASEEQNVSAVLTKVGRGEADAGLVYVTDVEAAGGEVDGIEIENADAATNVYPVTALTDAANPEAASAFVEFVTSEEGRAVLASFGFGTP
ncbi:molybdate ABC transporter substrate-binding protein [Agromyces humatus]|uniref:Molybdate ABC transporter substrate-binding protein n=1 Tax=Agromyces humatus TaxID=279573 RepID=A0ABN2K9V3_9MICO|nr:molybdate ABC transporter substrate-binding protein [Agromyces humatus]